MLPSPRLILAASLGLGLVAAPLRAVEPDAPRIAEVKIEGAQRIHPDRIRVRLGTRADSPFDRATLADDVRAIHAMRAFTGIRSEVEALADGRVRVRFIVEELPYVGAVEITGVDYFMRRRLRNQVRTRRGSHLDPQVLERDVLRLQQALRDRRYLHAKVSQQTQVDAESGVATVIFTVDPGYRVRVARVDFEGLPSGVVSFFLLNQLSNQPGGTFDPEMLEWDAGAVAQYLIDQGYLDARVRRVRDEFFDAIESWQDRYRHGPQIIPEGRRNDRVVITYFIDPGPRYHLDGVRFIHDSSIASEAELRSAFALADGEPFRRRQVDDGLRAVRRVIANQGYARVRIDDHRIIGSDDQGVELVVRIEEGQRYRVGRIDPDGNTVTRDRIVRRALSLEPGDLYNEDAIDTSRRNILRTGVFRDEPPRPLSIDPVFDPTRPDEVDLRVRVREDDTGRIALNLGWSSASGLSGAVSYQERNFDFVGAVIDRAHWRGGAQTLSANVSWSRQRTSFGVNLVNPRIFDSNYFLALGYQRSEDSNLAWDEKRQHASVTLGRYFFDTDLLLSVGYSYTGLSVDNLRLDASNETIIRIPGNYHVNTLSLRQVYDIRNNPSLPTSGLRIALEQNFSGAAGLSASHPYLELVGSAAGYLPLFESDLGGITFLELRQRVAYLRGLGEDGYVPFYNRYYGGGPAPRHRGYESFDQGPRRRNVFDYRSRPGGTREWLTSLELNVPIQGTNRGLRGILFADAGQIWDSYKMPLDEDLLFYQRTRSDDFWLRELLGLNDYSMWRSSPAFSAGDMKVAVGAGIRLPAFLPIALDIAYVLNPDTGQSSSQFHFSITGGF